MYGDLLHLEIARRNGEDKMSATTLLRFATAVVFVAVLCDMGLAQSTYSGPGPGIIQIGSTLIWNNTNAPDTFTSTTTFSSTPVLIDSGAVQVYETQVPTAANAEWDVFYLKTVDGGPLANDISALWQIVIEYNITQPVIFDQVVQQWLVSGTPVSPLTNGIGTICCASAANPILPGASYYNSGFSVSLPAGEQTAWKQIFVQPYSLVTNGGINPNTANEFYFALHFTLQPTVVAAVSASAFGEFPTFAPGSWIEIYGTNLANVTDTWGSSDFSGVIGPTTLQGTSVTIGNQPAYVDFVSPLQVNVQVPGGVGTGSQSLIVTTAAGSSAPFPVTVNATQPGLLAPSNFNVGGTQYVVAQFADGTYVAPPGAIAGVTSQRAKPGDTIVIYGVGFGPVTPNIPPGQLVEESNSLVAPFTMSFGGTEATSVPYYGLAPNYMGLYQFDVVVPAGAAASDTAPFTFSLGGVGGTQKLAIAIGN
jgi:uncharacterized protein (TIGR03437 family)